MTMTIEQAWERYERMIYSRCKSFHYSSGLDYKDLISEAKEVFMIIYFKYIHKPIEEFGKLLFICINNSLKGYVKKNKQYELPEQYQEQYTPEYMRFNDILDSLTIESKKAVERLFKMRKNIRNRTQFSSMMKNNLDYSYPTIWKCMKEIKEVLKNF